MTQRGNGGIIGVQNTPTLSAASGVWAANEIQRAAVGATWPLAIVPDPNFRNVTLLLNGEGTNGAQNNTFIDSSTNGFAITRNGNTTQGTFSPYGNRWSNYFDGTGDYLTLPASTAALQPGSGDFTIEFWYHYAISPTGYVNLFSYGASGNVLRLFLFTTNSLIVWTGATPIITANNAHVPNAWNHVAIVRNGLVVTLYVNGANVGTATGASATNYVGDLSIAFESGQTSLTGYLSNFRIVKGTAVYTANFTSPTAPLTAITNTSLLTCQANRILDASTNNFTVTRNGDVSVQRFSPFSPTAPYAAATIGGSGYFDGSGDWLNISSAPPASIRAWAANDFTVEAWVYPTSFTGWSFNDGRDHSTLVGNRSATGTSDYWSFGPHSDGVVRFYYWNGSVATVVSSGLSVPLNQWSHVAATKTASGIRMFVNGVASAFVAISGTPVTGSDLAFTVGMANNTALSGYVSDLRIVNGTAVYSGSTYTVPTAPLTAIANTSLLLNFTNGGVIDNSMLNDAETVGNVQISAGTRKYGNGSISIPGGGANLYIPPSPIFDMGTGDFTIECWVNSSSIAANYPSFISSSTGWSAGASGHRFNNLGAANKFTFHLNGAGDPFLTSTNTYSFGVWYHYALTRSGNTWRMFIDGVQQASGTFTGSFNAGLGGFRLGYSQWDATNGYYNGFIDDVRITRGVARYTANFTPPTVQLSGL